MGLCLCILVRKFSIQWRRLVRHCVAKSNFAPRRRVSLCRPAVGLLPGQIQRTVRMLAGSSLRFANGPREPAASSNNNKDTIKINTFLPIRMQTPNATHYGGQSKQVNRFYLVQIASTSSHIATITSTHHAP